VGVKVDAAMGVFSAVGEGISEAKSSVPPSPEKTNKKLKTKIILFIQSFPSPRDYTGF